MGSCLLVGFPEAVGFVSHCGKHADGQELGLDLPGLYN